MSRSLVILKLRCLRRIWRELRICASLDHKNILPVYGYAHTFNPLMAIVIPRGDHGNLAMCLEHKDAILTIIRRSRIVSLPL